MQIKLKQVFINDTNANNQPLINKNGEAYKMAIIKFDAQSGECKASMYIGKFDGEWDNKLNTVSQWKSGDVVDIALEKSGKYLNFNLSTKTSESKDKVNELERRLKKVEDLLSTLTGTTTVTVPFESSDRVTVTNAPPIEEDYPVQDEIDVADIPF